MVGVFRVSQFNQSGSSFPFPVAGLQPILGHGVAGIGQGDGTLAGQQRIWRRS